MVACFVPGCKSGHNNAKNCHLFRPSPLVAEKWCDIMSKIRSDTRFSSENPNHRVCSIHFHQEVIVKHDEFIIDGEKVTLERDRWTILKTAIPSIFPSVPKSIVPKIQGLRRKLTRSDTAAPTKKSKKHVETTRINETEEAIEIINENSNFCLQMWWSEHKNMFPKMILDESQNISTVFELSYQHGSPKVKWSAVFSKNERLESCKLFRDDRQVTFEMLQLNCDFNKTNLHVFLQRLNQTGFCAGINGFQDINRCKGGQLINNKWFSVKCAKYGPFTVCTECKKLFETLERKSHRPLKPMQNLNIKRRCAYYKKRTLKLAANNKAIRCEMLQLKSKIRNVSISQIEDKMKTLNFTGPAHASIMHALKAAQAKSAHGIRYTADWLFECLLLKIKSPAAYRHLRDVKILPLPHPSTLLKLIAAQRCEFGFHHLALDTIKKSLEGKHRRDRQGVIMFDEIKLRETLEYNKGTHRFEGFVDYGEFTDELVAEKDSQKYADHALVIMYRPFNDKWVQPIAAFATRNAANGKTIYKVVMEAIIKLETIGAEVVSVICDGAKPNKSFWKMCGVGEQNGILTNKAVHPCDENRYLYFSSDVPHLFKCIRNHCRKYTFVSFFSEEIDFSFYEKLLEEDSRRNFGLRKCPKLTRSHIWPNNFEKMVVSLATQLFSRSVATGLEFYRSMGVGGFEGSHSTENFTQQMNDIFDALNARLPRDGVRATCHKYNLLKTFATRLEELCHSNANERVPQIHFASKETLVALRITILSTIDIIDYLTQKMGYAYVLTGKVNQDCLEKFFGLIRAAGGREDHPTVTNFVQLFRLLSLYNPVKRMLRGNVRSGEEFDVLVAFETQLRTTAKENVYLQAKKQMEIEELLVQKLLEREDNCTDNSHEDISMLDKNLVYYLSGFLCYKSRKMVTCDDCINSISTSVPEMEVESTLTQILNYGPLHHPSKTFFSAVLSLESAICNALKTFSSSGDILLHCVNNVASRNISKFGCEASGHFESIVSSLFPYYITMRLHFYTRSKRNAMGHGKATRSKRKESKLTS